jgi:uncharacterized damage-inducible protein DinB
MPIFANAPMDSIDLICENLHRSEQIVLSRIEEMRDHCMVPPSSKGGCHTLWVLGHLAYIESLVVRTFMLGGTNPLASWETMFDRREVSGNPDDFVPFEEALTKCRATRAATNSLLESLNEADLDQASVAAPNGSEELFGTYRRCFQYAADHWFMHRGQLADARRVAGLERMWY